MNAWDGSVLAAFAALALLATKATATDIMADPDVWRPYTAPGTTLVLGSATGANGRCLRMTYDFGKTMAYVVAARDVDLALPKDFEISFSIMRSAPDDRLELKLQDAAGAMHVYKWYEFGAVGGWKRVVVRGGQFDAGTGPAAMDRVVKIELAITGGLGPGEIALDDFSISPRSDSAPAAAPAGDVPRWLANEQAYWTLAGVPGDPNEALLSEDGMIEPYKRGFTLVPLLQVDGATFTYTDATVTQSLERGYLPVPSVRWKLPSVSLDVTLLADGDPGSSVAHARYRVSNAGDQPVAGQLRLAIVPYQVYPPWQGGGGISQVRRVRYEKNQVLVNDDARIVLVTRPGNVEEAEDANGSASGAVEYPFALEPRGAAEFYVAFPLHAGSPVPADFVEAAETQRVFDERVRDACDAWDERIGRVAIEIPDEDILRMLKANIAYNLVTMDGPALQPGSRSYDKSWMRDGSSAANALLEMGLDEEALRFVEWIGGFQRTSGEIPPIIDTKAEDPLWEEKQNGLVEFDSQGEFIWAVAQGYRFTRDEAFLRRLFPRVLGAMNFLEQLRGRGLASAEKTFQGILPESTSHEGYYMKHSYWDDFWALKGWKDGRDMARLVGRDDVAKRAGEQYAALRDSTYASMRQVMEKGGIDFIPGCAELADFDAAATAVSLTYCDEHAAEIRPGLARTFTKYMDEVVRPRLPPGASYRYTPYELRNVPALLRLGRKADAWTTLRFLMDGRRPRAWQHLAEVVHSDRRFPTYIGDMPHTWVGAEFIHAFRSLFVAEVDDQLEFAQGVPEDWLARGGVTIRGLPTAYGRVDLRLVREGDTIKFRISGDMHEAPAGGYVWKLPDVGVRGVTLNGEPVEPGADGEIRFAELPAEFMLTVR